MPEQFPGESMKWIWIAVAFPRIGGVTALLSAHGSCELHPRRTQQKRGCETDLVVVGGLRSLHNELRGPYLQDGGPPQSSLKVRNKFLPAPCKLIDRAVADSEVPFAGRRRLPHLTYPEA